MTPSLACQVKARVSNSFKTLDLIVLRALHTMGPAARLRVGHEARQVSDHPAVAQPGPLYPALVRLGTRVDQGTWQKTESNRDANTTRSRKRGERELTRQNRSLRAGSPGSSTSSCSRAELPLVYSPLLAWDFSP